MRTSVSFLLITILLLMTALPGFSEEAAENGNDGIFTTTDDLVADYNAKLSDVFKVLVGPEADTENDVKYYSLTYSEDLSEEAECAIYGCRPFQLCFLTDDPHGPLLLYPTRVLDRAAAFQTLYPFLCYYTMTAFTSELLSNELTEEEYRQNVFKGLNWLKSCPEIGDTLEYSCMTLRVEEFETPMVSLIPTDYTEAYETDTEG